MFDFDLKVGWSKLSSYGGTLIWAENSHQDGIAYDNPILGPRLEIHPEVIGINTDGEKGPDNDCHSNHEVEDFSGPDVDEVPDDIDD
ncbi:hypothetical protein J1N35_001769 [Gossypium stocksii]|uniref:Uncharacterized protein n=1 Tax=Gossypium stocksii TaxID=47602 RepID=A0A9D3WK41_9ROSI|nr:hypothetical protein J1N35_001769 [Gossypium stocksii]